MTRLLLVLATVAALVGAASGAGQNAFPDRIELPDGFQPEGIAIRGTTFYVGSIPTGAIYRGNLRTGAGSVLVQGQSGRAAIGVELDRGRLFVAGGPTGMAFVYDARTGSTITSYLLSEGGSFINDVVVTKRAAWFTDSLKPVLYRVPLGPNGRPGAQSAVQTVGLDGDYEHEAGFNVNGIDARPNGKTLVVVQSNTGKLFAVEPDGDASEIELAGENIPMGGESVPMGDGILLVGRTLYVVQNRLNLVARIALSSKLDSGRVVVRTGNPGFDVPTTIDDLGRRLYAVNARFRMAPEPPLVQPADYWITQHRK
jgi:sugar lactone lactonase YvrE